jgi:hypothetical protein
MKPFAAAAIVAIGLACGPAFGAEPGWMPYRDSAYGFAIDLPVGAFSEQQEGSQLTLLEQHGAARLQVYAGSNEKNLSPSQFARGAANAGAVRTVTYQAGGRNWVVLSGYYAGRQSPTIFYAKFMFSSDLRTVSAFEISYPQDEKRAMDPVVRRLEHSLTAPSPHQ